jgi:hypothetical protein
LHDFVPERFPRQHFLFVDSEESGISACG